MHRFLVASSFTFASSLALALLIAAPGCSGPATPAADDAAATDAGGSDAVAPRDAGVDTSAPPTDAQAPVDAASPEDAASPDDAAIGPDAILTDASLCDGTCDPSDPCPMDCWICTPNETASCYDGPTGTAGVGLCVAGTHTCAADGLTFGPCMGEVVPQPERCETPADDDCDGLTPACGAADWAHVLGGSGADTFADVALLPDGSVIAGGSITRAVDFGCGTVTPPSTMGSAVLVHFDATGACLWSHAYGTAMRSSIDHLRAVTDGSIVVLGRFLGAIDLGGGPLSQGGPNLTTFVARLDGDGSHRWSRAWTATATTLARGMDVLGTGVAIVGEFTGSFDPGRGTITSVGGTDAFLVRLLVGNGAVDIVRTWGGLQTQSATAVAMDAVENMVVTGAFQGSVSFGGGLRMSHGGNDIFVVALDSGGSPLWDATFGDGADQQGLAITVLDAPNEVVVGGQMVGSVDFGGGTLTASGTDAFLVRLSLSNGGHVHSARFGDPSNQLVTQLVGLPDGSVIAGGPLSGGIDFGGGTFFSAGGGDFFLARMDATDGYVWARAYGGGSAETLGGIDSDGTVLVFGGSTDGAIDVGTGTLSSASGTPDTLVAHVRL